MLYSKIEGHGNHKKLVIIHGFLGMSDNWKSMALKFASDGFEVHSLDLRNHGRSFHSSEFNYEIMVTDIKAYCDANQITKTNIIGHSMGGKATLLLSTQYPELIQNMLIADIAPKSYPPHHQNILEGLNAVDFNTVQKRADVEEVLQQYITEIGTRQFLMKNLYRKEDKTFGFRFNLKVLTEKIEEIGKELPKEYTFNGNTLFLKGALSQYILDSDFTEIKRQFPNSTIETIDRAGHWLHAENPADFYSKAIPFLIQ